MNVVVFGSTGMIGHGVLLECLASADVARVVSVVRRASGMQHAKLEEIVHGDFRDFSSLTERLRDIDACFFCLGVSSAMALYVKLGFSQTGEQPDAIEMRRSIYTP